MHEVVKCRIEVPKKKNQQVGVFSTPRSATGKVFATVRALDTISTSASWSECITLITKVDNWVASISRNACLCLRRRKSPFSQSMNYGGIVKFFLLAYFWDYCEIGVHFLEKIKGIVKKGNCANNFQYRLNFSKKNLKSKLLSGKQFFSTQVS